MEVKAAPHRCSRAEVNGKTDSEVEERCASMP